MTGRRSLRRSAALLAAGLAAVGLTAAAPAASTAPTPAPAVAAGPAEPERIRPDFDSGDHLHPNDAGAAALADAVPLRLFR